MYEFLFQSSCSYWSSVSSLSHNVIYIGSSYNECPFFHPCGMFSLEENTEQLSVRQLLKNVWLCCCHWFCFWFSVSSNFRSLYYLRLSRDGMERRLKSELTWVLLALGGSSSLFTSLWNLIDLFHHLSPFISNECLKKESKTFGCKSFFSNPWHAIWLVKVDSLKNGFKLSRSDTLGLNSCYWVYDHKIGLCSVIRHEIFLFAGIR